ARLYPFLRRDLLLAGAILHDVGKTREFSQGYVGDYTDEGRLLGHLVIGVGMLDDKLAERLDFPASLALLLRHLIVSHHGEYEMGSPKKPKIMEALALNMLDDLDAKMNGIGGYIDGKANPGTGWTDYHRLMERFFFRPSPLGAETPTAAEGPAPAKTRRPRTRPARKPSESEAGGEPTREAKEKTDHSTRQEPDQPLLWGD
ncbi:MAG: HD domain-containing protein, partial [Pseudomonadota bacterium]